MECAEISKSFFVWVCGLKRKWKHHVTKVRDHSQLFTLCAQVLCSHCFMTRLRPLNRKKPLTIQILYHPNMSLPCFSAQQKVLSYFLSSTKLCSAEHKNSPFKATREDVRVTPQNAEPRCLGGQHARAHPRLCPRTPGSWEQFLTRPQSSLSLFSVADQHHHSRAWALESAGLGYEKF